MLGCRTRRTAIGAMFVVLGLAPGVARAGGFLPPKPIHSSTDVGLSIAVDANGNTLAVWDHKNTPPTPDTIQGAKSAPGSNLFTQLPDFSTDTTPNDDNTQPVVVSNRLHNVPVGGVYNWDPGAHFGIYHTETFWLASDAPTAASDLPNGKKAQ